MERTATLKTMSGAGVRRMMAAWQIIVPVCFLVFGVKHAEKMDAGAWAVFGAAFAGWLIVTLRALSDWQTLRVVAAKNDMLADLATRSIWGLMIAVNVFALLLLLGMQFLMR